MDNIRALMDRLEQQSRARREANARPGGTSAPVPSDPLLKFQPGDRVLDLANGRRGIVQAGARDDTSTRQVFEIELLTGETVYRSSAELSRDTLPRSPANR